MTASLAFASPEWADALAAQLRGDAQVRTDSMTWIFGPLLLVVDASAEHGLEATGVRIDLHEGDVRGVELVPVEEAARTPFAVGGSLARWKSVFAGELPVVEGVLQARLRVRGDLPTLMRHRGLLAGIARAGAGIGTTWQDEVASGEPAAASAG